MCPPLTQLEVRLVHNLSTAYCTQSKLSLSPPNLQIWNHSSSKVHIVQCSPLMCNFYKRTSPAHPSHSPLGLLTEIAQNAPQEGTSPDQRLRNFKKGLPQTLFCAPRAVIVRVKSKKELLDRVSYVDNSKLIATLMYTRTKPYFDWYM